MLSLVAMSLMSYNFADIHFSIDATGRATLASKGEIALRSPAEGLWSVATEWKNGWPAGWRHAKPQSVTRYGDWTIVQGAIEVGGGVLKLRDAYVQEQGVVRGIRRFEWTGKETLGPCTLSIRWLMPNAPGAHPLLPGISYFGNPSGAKTKSCVPIQTMAPGEESQYEEHRYPMPFASLEGKNVTTALHTLPSMPVGANRPDQWWSLGIVAGKDEHELRLLSGPVASNGMRNVVKAQQGRFLDYPDTWITLKPGMIVEKTFYLEVHPTARPGSGFIPFVDSSLRLFEPYSLDGMPTYRSIIDAKMAFANSRWREKPEPGYEMYPDSVKGTHFVMGWCGQAEAMGYALLALNTRLDAETKRRVQKSLDLLSTSPFNEDGFALHYEPESKTWKDRDNVSQGQAMESFSRAIELGRKKGMDTRAWETFLQKASDFHARRSMRPGWRPVSTNEAFLVSPLLRSARLFKNESYRQAALHIARYYAARHLSMAEPYWGGTLDASCEDKEGAWAAFQAFLACYEDTKDREFLRWAEHAMYVTLSYTMVWDIDLPPGRLKDHQFKSRGWTAVSAQNQHLDVFGVFYTPEIYRMGELLQKPDLKRLALVMFRSGGQLIDPLGSQGEQIQQTNFAQHGDMSDVYKLRGGYSEGWTVFWITTHFLHAAGRFREMNVKL